MAAADLNYDFRTDLALAGPGGLCLLRQDPTGRLHRRDAAAKLPAALLRAPAYGVWPADIDTDGDLDLVLAPRDGRRSCCATTATARSRRAICSPIDHARPRLRLGGSRRRGRARRGVRRRGRRGPRVPEPARRSVPRARRCRAIDGQAVAIAAREATTAMRCSICSCSPRDGAIARLSRATPRTARGRATAVARVDPPPGLEPGAARLLTADLDNNGAADLIVAGPASARVLLGGPGGSFTPLSAAASARRAGVADLDGDGRLEMRRPRAGRAARARRRQGHEAVPLAGCSGLAPRPRPAISASTRSASAARSRSARDCTLQKQLITSPVVHFGLGDAAGAEVVRITWPNGVLQAEFDTQGQPDGQGDAAPQGIVPVAVRVERPRDGVRDRSDLAIAARAAHQRAGDGRRADDRGLGQGARRSARAARRRLRSPHHRGAVGDALLRSRVAAGRRSPRRHRGVRRRALRGAAAEAAASSPPGPVQPFALGARRSRHATCPSWRRPRRFRHIDFAGRGAYQGITRAHFVEMELPDAAPRTGPLWLVAQGWIHPTDSSINVAIGQGAHDAPEGLSLHVADAAGRFRDGAQGARISRRARTRRS